MAAHDEEDLDRLAPRERARASSRDRKVRGPKVIMDNPSLRDMARARAQRLREQLRRRR